MQKKIKVMVIDDSVVFRTWLIQNISRDPRFEVIGFAINAFDAKNKIPILKPDVVTLDIEMPGMSGIDFLKEFLPTYPLPVILVSSLNVRVFDALSAGAVDFVRKPDAESNMQKDAFLAKVLAKLTIASASHVRLAAPQASAAAGTGVPVRRNVSSGLPGAAAPGAAPAARALAPSKFGPGANEKIIAIGASTGGTEAILEVVRQFPANMPGVVITQHMPAGFTAMYAERLNRLCKMEVREAKNGDRVQPGLALLAPGGLQMRVVRIGMGYAVQCVPGDKVNGHCPSVDVLFESVANLVKDKAIGVILTGMGADGAAGLLRMRKNGAYTIGQDRESCVVYGMPMEAYKIGAVCMQSSLSSIPQAVFAKL